MKRKNKHKSLLRIHLYQEHYRRLRRKSKRKKRLRNIFKYRKRIPECIERGALKVRKPLTEIIVAPVLFSLLNNTEDTLDYIAKIDQEVQNKHCTTLRLDLRDVDDIDIGTLSILLAKINRLKQQNIVVETILPRNQERKRLFFESGFAEHMYDVFGQKIHSYYSRNNLMIQRGFDKTSNKQLGNVMKQVMYFLTNQEESYRPVYSIAQEMCANSIEHANKQYKNWLFSVWYRDCENVCFTMTDIGSGIIETLHRKFSQRIAEYFFRDDTEVLIRAFEKKYGSSTLDENRNKGLPKIQHTAKLGYISNLKVITNGVYVDIVNSAESKVLNTNFKGTFYYWELNKNNIETWKQRNCN